MRAIGCICGVFDLETHGDDRSIVAWMAIKDSFDPQSQLAIIDFGQRKSRIDHMSMRSVHPNGRFVDLRCIGDFSGWEAFLIAWERNTK
jgi:hypothetical protein